MSGNHNSTRSHNLSVLTKDLGLKQDKNSTIFENQKYFVLSPSVQNKNNWFDLRKVNLDKKPFDKQNVLLIRLLDNFILIDLNKIITELCNSEPYDTKNSGIHWKFQIKKNESNRPYIFNTKSKERMFVDIIGEEKLIEEMR